MKILVLNCGSSSIKYKLYDMNNDQVLASGGVERIGLDNAFIKVALPNGEKKQIMHDMPDHKEGVNFVFQVLLDKEIGALQSVNEIDAVGHRVVQGGDIYTESVLVTPQVEKDIEDLRFALKLGVDMVALSFVRSPADVELVHQVMDEEKRRVPVIAKLEKPEAVDALESIILAFDGIMVARGDLGVEVPLEEVPLVQKRAIQIARENAKPVIVATQMLDSMIENSRPTRAEASDVANAVLDGADAVMLSGETSVGRDPQNVVSTMSRIVKSAEADGEVPQLSHMPRTKRGVISYSARDIAERLNAKALVAFTTSGDTARRVARLHTHLPLLVFTPNQEVRSQLALTWGAQTFLCPVVDSTDSMMREIDEALLAMDEYNRDDMMVVVAGTPPGVTGNTNMIHVHPLGEDLHRNVKEDLNKATKETAKKESKKAKPAVKKK